MKIDLKVFNITPAIWDAIHKIWAAGGEVYVVGGSVRDHFLGKTPKDLDLCVTGLAWEEMEDLFPGSKIQGKEFPIFNIAKCDFALARKERKIACGYHGFKPWVDKSLTIYDDLVRRDFTVNSIAVNTRDGEVIDPHNGYQDIQDKVLRATSLAFSEDPLRVIRGARFAAQHGMKVAYDTLRMMQSLRPEMKYLSVDRVSVELQGAMKGKQPEMFFKVLKEADVLDIHFKELFDLIDVPQSEKYHKYDAFGHTMECLRVGASLTENPIYRYGVLVHDLGKGITPIEKLPQHPGHEEAGVQLVEDLGKRLKGLPNDWTQAGKLAAALHLKFRLWKEMRQVKVVDMITGVARTPLGLDGLAIVAQADHMGRGFDVEADLNPYELARLGKEMLQQVTGSTITVKEGTVGKAFGEALRIARAEWLKENM